MDTYNILHLSDLHIGEEKAIQFNYLLHYLGEKLETNKIHTVIFTGDIFDKPPVIGNDKNGPINEKDKKDLIEIAVNFFIELLNYLKKDNKDLDKKDFLFVAGNHDLYRQEQNDTWSLYNDFLNEFYCSNIPEYYMLDKHMLIKVEETHKKIFLGFDSNIDDKDGEELFVGHITNEQLETANSFLKINPQYQDYYKIAFFHHPCNFFEERERRNTDGILNNSLDVSKSLAKWDVKLVLYGHKHWLQPSIYRPLAGQEIYMFAGGAIGRLRDICSGNIIEIGKEIHLKEIISTNTNKFNINYKEIPDDYMEGLLVNETSGWKINLDSDIKRVIKMIDKLYLSYEQFNFLKYSQSRLCILKNSILYKLGNENEVDLSEEKKEVEWSVIREILDDSENIRNIRDRLQINPTEKCYVAFALLGGFFAELYNKMLIIKPDIWSEYSTRFNLGNSCYYIFFDLRRGVDVSEAQQKLDEIMELFQLKLYELQEYLYCIKLNIKYIFLEIQNNGNEIRHCNFDASVTRLMKLLTGTNIYCNEYSFVRELIQNAIDAVSFWENPYIKNHFNKASKTKEVVRTTISVELGCDCEKHKYFKIRDYGIGMKQDIIRLYFSTLGRSYYKEYTERRNINYNSVSNFGIGFLSVFKPCKKIVINTRHFSEDKSYKLKINSYCGHYTISSNTHEEFPVGTEIICYFRDSDVDFKGIIDYIKKIMLDIKYDIDIKYINAKGNNVNEKIKARKIRSVDYNNVVFIPFDEDEKRVIKLKKQDEKPWCKILEEAMNNYRHGILIRTEKGENAGVDILSAGILLENAGLKDLFGKGISELQHMKVTLNFPPNWLDIDVSREKVNGRRVNIQDFENQICNELKKQIQVVLKNKENYNIPLIFFQEVLMLSEIIEQDFEKGEGNDVLLLNMFFENNTIKFSLNYDQDRRDSHYLSSRWKMKFNAYYDNTECERNHETIKLMYRSLPHEDVSSIFQLFQEKKDLEKIGEVMKNLGLDLNSVDKKYLPLVPALFLNNITYEEKDNEEKKLFKFVEASVLEICEIGDMVNENNMMFSIKYDNRELNRISMVSDRLKDRVDRFFQQGGRDCFNLSATYQYDFVWKNIIWAAFKKCNLSFKNNINSQDIQNEKQSKYEHLRDKIKILYGKRTEETEELLLDIYTIASCYMSILMEIPKESLEFKEASNETAKYIWIFQVGVGLLYMWICSDNEVVDNEVVNKRWNNLSKLYNDEGLYSQIDDNIKNRFIQILASKEKETFDILCFAELLRWLDDYIKKD